MHQLQPVFQPPNNDKGLMEKLIIPLLLVGATLIGTIIGAIIQGTTHIIGFDWIVAVFVVSMFCVMFYCIWFVTRAKKKFQERYKRDVAVIKNDATAYRNTLSQSFADETQRWNEWAVTYSQAVAKEHKEQAEKLEAHVMEAIHDAEIRLDGSIKNAQSQFSSSVDSYKYNVQSYGEHLVQAWKDKKALEERIEALEEQLKKEPVPESEEAP